MTEFTPIAEYNLWYHKEKELYSILEQLKNQFCINVVDNLRSQRSTIIPKWDDLIADVESNFKLAKENSDYLSTITDYIEVYIALYKFSLSIKNTIYFLSLASMASFCPYRYFFFVFYSRKFKRTTIIKIHCFYCPI